jgi:Fe-S cluster assembly protein SufD
MRAQRQELATSVPTTADAARALLAAAGMQLPQSIGIQNITPNTHEVTVTEDACLVIAPGSEVTVTDLSAKFAALILGEGSIVRYSTITEGYCAQRFAYLLADARLDWSDALLRDSAESRNTICLAGDGADAKYRSALLCVGDEHCSTSTTMVHRGNRTASSMLTRAALLDHSEAKYRGTVRILPDAAGCDAYQRADTLLLGDSARMDATPVLEIANNDVRCTHGVTLGQVDDEQLFYLESRGIARPVAMEMVLEGFFDQILISMGEHGRRVQRLLLERMHHAPSGGTR